MHAAILRHKSKLKQSVALGGICLGTLVYKYVEMFPKAGVRAMGRKLVIGMMCAALIVPVAGCAKNSSQSVYDHSEIGKSVAVSFGTVIARREIDINGKNTGTGALIGGAAGAGVGSYMGSGSGSIWVAAAGLIVGAAVGAIAEQAAADRKGIEYTIILKSGVVMTVAQEVTEKDVLLNEGDRVIVQNSRGYQRVLPASNLPTKMARPKGITLVDDE